MNTLDALIYKVIWQIMYTTYKWAPLVMFIIFVTFEFFCHNTIRFALQVSFGFHCKGVNMYMYIQSVIVNFNWNIESMNIDIFS